MVFFDVRKKLIEYFNVFGFFDFVFLLFIRVGGFGINLEMVDMVIIFDVSCCNLGCLIDNMVDGVDFVVWL